jgi:hypothetical protein
MKIRPPIEAQVQHERETFGSGTQDTRFLDLAAYALSLEAQRAATNASRETERASVVAFLRSHWAWAGAAEKIERGDHAKAAVACVTPTATGTDSKRK